MKKIVIGIMLGCYWLGLVNASPLPKPWYQSNLEQFKAGVLEVSLEDEDDKFIRYGYLKSTGNSVTKGSVLQNISPLDEWLGYRVRLTGRLKSNSEYGHAVMFMSIDHGYGIKTYDYMSDRRIKGKRDWQEYSIVLDIPQESSAYILFGVSLSGKGEVYFDDFEFEVVDSDIEVTGTMDERRKKGKPRNLNFENGVIQ